MAANRLALMETLRTKICTLWSTSRNELWVKGKTSGDFLDLVEIRCNCEQNSLLYMVRPRRTGACHTKDSSGSSRRSCYYRRLQATASGNSDGGDTSAEVFLEHLTPVDFEPVASHEAADVCKTLNRTPANCC